MKTRLFLALAVAVLLGACTSTVIAQKISLCTKMYQLKDWNG